LAAARPRREPFGAPLAFLLIIAALACARDRPPPARPQPLAGSWQAVSPGDTLETIASRAGVPAEDILEINGLHRGDLLHPGQMLFVPSPAVVIAPAGAESPASAPSLAAVGSASLGARPTTLKWPLGQERSLIASPFGMRDGRRHEGIDLPAPTGTPVFAAADGVVAYAGNRIRGYGNMVVVRHGGDLMTVYAHNSMILVSQGQPVRSGDRIALVGQSGRASGPHLHFEVRVGQSPHDPMRFLGR
jgi:murein DD-endopeptidase MepM/ murein hydrolase activator NlpD